MRDILFRGKRVDNGEWVYGYFVKSDGKINNGECFILQNATDFSYGDNGNRIRIGCFVKIVSDTVGQYSGLKDANDVNIYEGDIIKTTDYFGKQRLFIVCFDNGMFLADTSALRSWLNPISALEVVGNIHDNPDMLTNEGEG